MIKPLVLVFFIINFHSSLECSQERILASIEFLNIIQNKYGLITSLNQIQHSICEVEEVNHKVFYIYKIKEFLDRECELRIVLNKENYLLPDPISEFQDEVVNYTLLEEDDFLITNPDQNCLEILKKENNAQKIERVKEKIQKDLLEFARNLGTQLFQRGYIVFASYMHGDQEKFDLSLFQFFVQEINYFYNDSIQRYEQIFIELIPHNKEEIQQILQQEFSLQKEKLIAKWSNSSYNFGKKLANEVIHYLTGISNQKLEFVEKVLENVFPNIKKQSLIVIQTIIQDIEQILDKIFSLKQIVITVAQFFRQKIQKIAEKLELYEGRIIQNLSKDCKQSDISKDIIIYIIQNKIFKSQFFLENYLNCTQEQDNQYTLIFQINQRQCLMKFQKDPQLEIISQQNEDCRNLPLDQFDITNQINKGEQLQNQIRV